MPADASFVIQDGFADGAQHAVYLCNYYGGYPACGSGEAYEDVLTAPPGTEVIYHVWRELDVNGTQEVVKEDHLIAGDADEVVSVTYDFQR